MVDLGKLNCELDLPVGGSVKSHIMAIKVDTDNELLGQRYELYSKSECERQHLLKMAKCLRFHDFEIADLERLYGSLLTEEDDEHW